ncbi:tyrosinase family protein [Phaeobacter sp. B1627]|uniref:tyrosinase family protein n=1 Tax=Phaeobacter sp. B1627 TaxID=2583809 RepID=UPI0011199F64|nr:tyrosinase family protein [Phaeobacter sp. B1627]TNJ48066.1 tyrosinase family protein [Phaeobacter sp. B1627]
MITAKPTWVDDIQGLFAAPFWLPPEDRAKVGQGWLGCMRGYLIDLADYDSVREWSVTIYDHLISRSMPLTDDTRQFWPLDALETFRLWVNQGWRRDAHAPFDEAPRIPKPAVPRGKLRMRRDLAAMSAAEIDDFRARLDDVMDIGNPAPTAPWQKWAYIHTNWCLHYQEAFALWHRAYLVYLENLLGCAIPYWDFMAADASKPDSPQAGLPQAFLDETYVHPGTRETRPNPLRFAAAKDGQSKYCAATGKRGGDCLYVHRDPLFYTRGDDHRAERARLFAMAGLFQQQVVDALAFDTFSVPQGSPGFPWANIPAFTPPQPDKDYPYRDQNFDGAFEQPHDNYHGWIGPDMADNAYTAFDPVFISYHANIDRMLERWIRSHPVAQYSVGVPLRPFVGQDAAVINERTSELWRYTTLGDMAQDSRHIGYDYGPPAAPQFKGAQHSGGRGAVAAAAGATHAAWVIFDGVRCTHDSYAIDVFLGGEAGQAGAENPAYVGRFSRIGMGIQDDKGRCIRHGVSRMLDAAPAARALGLPTGSDPGLAIRVTHLHENREVTPDEYRTLPGFVPFFHWGDARCAPIDKGAPGQCCSA